MDSLIAPKLAVTQVLRLALLLHCFKAALYGSDGLSEVRPETLRGAIALGEWVYVHQRRTPAGPRRFFQKVEEADIELQEIKARMEAQKADLQKLERLAQEAETALAEKPELPKPGFLSGKAYRSIRWKKAERAKLKIK